MYEFKKIEYFLSCGKKDVAYNLLNQLKETKLQLTMEDAKSSMLMLVTCQLAMKAMIWLQALKPFTSGRI